MFNVVIDVLFGKVGICMDVVVVCEIVYLFELMKLVDLDLVFVKCVVK